MASVTTPLTEEAESIFTDLGYAVSTEGRELRAERKWRVVQVTPVESDPKDLPTSGNMRCFVTWKRRAREVRDRLATADLDYEWAVIGVDDGGSYEVYREPAAAITA